MESHERTFGTNDFISSSCRLACVDAERVYVLHATHAHHDALSVAHHLDFNL